MGTSLTNTQFLAVIQNSVDTAILVNLNTVKGTFGRYT